MQIGQRCNGALLILLFFSLLLSSCGGGGGGGGTGLVDQLTGYSISGTVNGAVVSGVLITLKGSATSSTITDANGKYTLSGLTNGDYTVAPSLAGYIFSPNSTAVSIRGANVTNKDFTATAHASSTYSISGTVSGPYVEGVLITMSGTATGTANTSADGSYSFSNLPAGNYTITPALAGYTYNPAAPTFGLGADKIQNFTAVSAIASYSISGTVGKSTTRNGRIYLRVYRSSSGTGSSPVAGTSINAAGAYTVRGLGSGNYVVTAEMDLQDTGEKNANNPIGAAAPVNLGTADLAGVDILIADPAPPAPVTPSGLTVYPTNDSALIVWDTPMDGNNSEIATSYRIYWGTDPAATSGAPITVKARDDGSFIQSGLINGSAHYYKISALVGATESAASGVVGPMTIGPAIGANTVSGTITCPGPITGPMLVLLSRFDTTSGTFTFRSTWIANPTSPQNYSISGVPNGVYYSYAIVDMNNNGLFDYGDLTSYSNDSMPPEITVSGYTTGNDLAIRPAAEPTAKVSTFHWLNGATENYSFNLDVREQAKQIVKVVLVSGVNAAVPLDMGKGNNQNFGHGAALSAISPTVGDTYGFKVTFSDGTTETISGSVTAVINSLPQNLAVRTTAPGTATVPLFTWAPPAFPPATAYTYMVYVVGADSSWFSGNPLPSTTMSILYNADGRATKPTLTLGVPYTWYLYIFDADDNYAITQSTYTP